MNRFHKLRNNYKKAVQEVEECEEKIRQACAEVFPDVDKNRTGNIGIGEFLSVFLHSEDLTEEDVHRLMIRFSQIDSSGDGRLSLEEVTHHQLRNAGVPEVIKSKSCREKFCKKVGELSRKCRSFVKRWESPVRRD